MMNEHYSQAAPFVFASVLTGYPDSTFARNVITLLEDPEVDRRFSESCPDDWTQLRPWVDERCRDFAKLEDLRSEYIDLFDRGRDANPLYETEYGRQRAMVKGNELADIAAFYKAFGLEFGKEGSVSEMLDHVSVELEFYAILVMKQVHVADKTGAAVVRDARCKFMKDHLGRFVPSIAERPGVRNSEFYSTVFRACAGLIASECRNLGIAPDRASWIEGQKESEGMACGSLGGNCS